jgi:hypothetical protein
MKKEYKIFHDIWETVLAITASQKGGGGKNFNWVFVTEFHFLDFKLSPRLECCMLFHG